MQQFRQGDLIFVLPDPDAGMVNTGFVIPGEDVILDYEHLVKPNAEGEMPAALRSIFPSVKELEGGKFFVGRIINCCVLEREGMKTVRFLKVACNDDCS